MLRRPLDRVEEVLSRVIRQSEVRKSGRRQVLVASRQRLPAPERRMIEVAGKIRFVPQQLKVRGEDLGRTAPLEVRHVDPRDHAGTARGCFILKSCRTAL